MNSVFEKKKKAFPTEAWQSVTSGHREGKAIAEIQL
jgi:hypothetical protein